MSTEPGGKIVISESLGLSTTLGTVLRVLTLAVLAAIAYAQLNNKITNAVEQGKRNEFQIKETQELLDSARMDLGRIGAKFDQFLNSYDRDMNRYIREDKDRR